MMYTLSQVSGYIALALIAISFFCKNKNMFLIFQTIANIFYAIAYLFINVWVAGVITIFASVRCIVFYICENKEIEHRKITIPLFIAIDVIITILFWQGYSDILPLITGSLYTIIYTIKRPQLIRYLCIAPSVALCIYNLCFRLYSSALLDMFEIIVLVVSIIYYTKKNTQDS